MKTKEKESVSKFVNYLLACFNDYDVSLQMEPSDVRTYIIKFANEYEV